MKLTYRLFFIFVLTLASALYIFPWDNYGVTLPSWVKPYKLGLDLHGGVELDYDIDLTAVRSQTGGVINEAATIDSLK
jgi:preprotein translocase subunit SecD